MRLLILSQHFWPEVFRINEISRSLAERGIKVDVLTGKPNYPEGKFFAGYSAVGFMRETWNGISIFRLPLFPRGSGSRILLFLNYLSFILSGIFFGPWLLRNENADVVLVYATSPLLQALPALFIGRLKRIPVIVYVQDLWPESLEATGYVTNRIILRLVELIVSFIYRHSDLILVSSQPFKESILRLNPASKIIYYPNSVDPIFCEGNACSRVDLVALDAGFCVVFAGNLGKAQALSVIVEAAGILRPYPEIRFVIFGSGSSNSWLQRTVIELGLNNLILAGRFPFESMPNILQRASVLLVTLADKDIFAATVPNKIQAYMAVGRPIIASMNGEGARLVEDAGAGIAVKAEDSKALAEAVLKLYSSPREELDKMGYNGRSYYRQHFDHEMLITELIQHLIKIVE